MPDNIKPSLSIAGWISAPVPKLDELLADFYSAEYSQTYLYYGHVASIQQIVQSNNNDPSATCAGIRTTLKRYLERYFNEATVEAEWINRDTGQNKADIRIAVSVLDSAGKTYSFHDVVSVMNSKVVAILNANNGV